ncbi:hypothetical protein MHK_004182, partial [Candidatus Magnetomorum sp. HK-1]
IDVKDESNKTLAYLTYKQAKKLYVSKYNEN